MRQLVERLNDEIRALSGYAAFAMPDATLTSLVDSIELWTGRLIALQAAVVREIDGRGLVKKAGSVNASAWLRDRARISIHAAHQVTTTGAVLDARPVLAAAVVAGAMTPEQAVVIGKALDDIPADAGPDVMAKAKARLVENAAQFAKFGPARVDRVGLAFEDAVPEHERDPVIVSRSASNRSGRPYPGQRPSRIRRRSLEGTAVSHHLDSPSSRQDSRLNVTDTYIFDGSTGTALVMAVNTSLAGDTRTPGFHPDARYEFKIHFDGAADESVTYRFIFADMGTDGTQPWSLYRLSGADARDDAATGVLVVQGRTGGANDGGGVRAWAGPAADPFYVNSRTWSRQPRTRHERTCRSIGGTMDKLGETAGERGDPVPDPLRSLFNDADNVRVQHLPCELPGLDSLAVHFGAGARTVPHRHVTGQHLVYTDGVGVVADESGVHVVHAGDVVSNPPGAWHWHGATPGSAATHVTFEAPGDFDLAVERRDWDATYPSDLGS